MLIASGRDDCFSRDYMCPHWRTKHHRELQSHVLSIHKPSEHAMYNHTWINVYIENLQTITARANRPYFNIPIVYSSRLLTTSYWQKITSILVNAIVYVISMYERIYSTFCSLVITNMTYMKPMSSNFIIFCIKSNLSTTLSQFLIEIDVLEWHDFVNLTIFKQR